MTLRAIVIRRFPTEIEARAFAEGVECVNDSAISDVTVAPIGDGHLLVTFVDADADPEDYATEVAQRHSAESTRLLTAGEEEQESRGELTDALFHLIHHDGTFRRLLRAYATVRGVLATYFARKAKHEAAADAFIRAVKEGAA
jgi:hypothetical protein